MRKIGSARVHGPGAVLAALLLCGCNTPLGQHVLGFKPKDPYTLPGAPGSLNLAIPETPAEHFSGVIQQVRAIEDDKKVLTERLALLQEQLAEKDEALALANRELERATDDVRRTRDELARWRREVAALRERLRTSEKENAGTLQAIIKVLEQLDREQDPSDK